jgi:hypothetical protein
MNSTQKERSLMKWQRLVACEVIMVACCGALTAQPIDGLVLKVSMDKAVYEPGEAITLSLQACNEGSQRIDVMHNELGYQLCLDGRLYRFDPDQINPLSGEVARYRAPGVPIQHVRMRSSRLEPEQASLTLTLSLSETYWLAQTGGKLVMRPGDHVAYLATGTMPMPLGMSTRIPQGRSLSMSRALPAIPSPAASKPVFFQIAGDPSVMQSLYYGRIVFEDRSPAVVSALSLNPSIFMGPPDGGTATYMAQVENNGTFVVGLAPQEVAQINQGALILRTIYGNIRRVRLLSEESSPIDLASLGKLISEPGVVTVARPPVYYGRILCEDGTVPGLNAGRNSRHGVTVGTSRAMRVPGKSGLDETGLFAMFVSAEQMERQKSGNVGYAIYNGPPTLQANGRMTRVPVAEFPMELLSLDKVQAGVMKIPKLERPTGADIGFRGPWQIQQ